MTKRVFIAHGWGGAPQEGWFPWLKKELEEKGFQVTVPAMPQPKHPKIEEWVRFLRKVVRKPDENTFLVGHSIGAQTVLRYLESLSPKVKVGGVILLAGWINLSEKAFENAEDFQTARPWLDTPIDWQKIKSHTSNFTAIFSDNDHFVPLTDSKIFKEKLGAKIVIEKDKAHYSGSDGITELSIVLKELLDFV